MFFTWLTNPRAKSRRMPAAKTIKTARIRLTLESLEDRCVPTTLTVSPASPYHTIAGAVAAAKSGDVINVNPGTYREQVIIPATGSDGLPITSLTLHSLYRAAAVIQSPTNLTSGLQAIIDVNGALGVTIDGFKITGKTAGTLQMAGVYVEGNGSATISNSSITGIQSNNALASGIGVLVGNNPDRVGGTGTKGNAIVTRDMIDNYFKGGVDVVNGSSATVSNNTITGIGSTTLTAQYGIQFSDGATGTATGNVISGNVFNDPSGATASAGILLFGPGPGVSILNNSLGNVNGNRIPAAATNDVGLWVFDAAGATIKNNSASGNKYFGFAFDKATTGNSNLTVSRNASTLNIGDGFNIAYTSSSSFSFNNSSGNGGSGFWLSAADVDNSLTNNTGTRNKIYGLLIADFDPNGNGFLNSSTSTGNTICMNTFTQNGVANTLDLSMSSMDCKPITASIMADFPSLLEPPHGGADVPYTFTISLDSVPTQAVTVYYRTVDVTAKAGEDYGGQMGHVTFAAGSQDASATTGPSMQITIFIKSDFYRGQDPETFAVVLTSAYNAVIDPAHNSATGAIKQVI